MMMINDLRLQDTVGLAPQKCTCNGTSSTRGGVIVSYHVVVLEKPATAAQERFKAALCENFRNTHTMTWKCDGGSDSCWLLVFSGWDF
jgi:hypothetical protein